MGLRLKDLDLHRGNPYDGRVSDLKCDSLGVNFLYGDFVK